MEKAADSDFRLVVYHASHTVRRVEALAAGFHVSGYYNPASRDGERIEEKGRRGD